MITNQDFDRLAARVRNSARDGGLIDTAQVRLVGLDDVRRAAGPRWPRMRELVREGSLKIIAARISPEDTVVPCGDGFLIVFADEKSGENEKVCAGIREALITFYLGEEAIKPLRAEIETQTVSAAALANIVGATPKPAARTRADLKLGGFWPVWSGRRQAVSAFLCAPAPEQAPPSRMAYIADFGEKPQQDADFLDLDLCLMEQAFEAAEQTDGLPIGLSVHASTLRGRKTRNLYLKHLAANASPAKSRMFVSIAEIPPGTPLLSLTEWVSGLKATFTRVSLEFHRSDRALSGIASAGVWAAGFHVASCKGAQPNQIRAALNELDTCCRVLRRQGVQPFIHGFNEPGFFDLASFSDIAFATGQSLWPCQTTPSLDAAQATAVETLTRA